MKQLRIRNHNQTCSVDTKLDDNGELAFTIHDTQDIKMLFSKDDLQEVRSILDNVLGFTDELKVLKGLLQECTKENEQLLTERDDARAKLLSLEKALTPELKL